MSIGGAMGAAAAAGVGPGLACAARTTARFKLMIKPCFMGPPLVSVCRGVKRNTRFGARETESPLPFAGREQFYLQGSDRGSNRG